MSRWFLPAVLLGAACATAPSERPPQPPAPASVQNELGDPQVLLAGAEYARQQGYEVSADAAQAVQLRPNVWRVRFGLAPRGSGKFLELDFDKGRGQVVREQEIQIVPSATPPSSSTPGSPK